MYSNNDGKDNNTSYSLTVFDKKTLAETRKYTKTCGNKIAEDKTNFADKSALGLWWDAKGLFNSSDAEEVTAHMERYRKFYEEMDAFSAQVEEGDPKCYERLLKINEKLEEMERDAVRDAENNKSSAICRMLREFLDKKFNLDHNLKKVECIVLRQKMSNVEQSCQSFNDKASRINENMEKLIEENRAVRRESDEKLSKLIEENLGVKENIEIMRKEKEKLASEAEKRMEEERRKSDEKLQQVLKEAEERSEARLQNMVKENEKLRLEAERIRQETDEKLKEAVEEANRRSEARIQEMAEQNRASLQKMAKMLEAMNIQ